MLRLESELHHITLHHTPPLPLAIKRRAISYSAWNKARCKPVDPPGLLYSVMKCEIEQMNKIKKRYDIVSIDCA